MLNMSYFLSNSSQYPLPNTNPLISYELNLEQKSVKSFAKNCESFSKLRFFFKILNSFKKRVKMEYSHNWLLSNILLLLKMCDFNRTCFGDHLWDPKMISLDRWSLNRLNAIKTNLMGFKKRSPFTGGLCIEMITMAGFTVYDFY